MMDVSREEMVQAMKWKLGFPEPGYQEKRLDHIWQLFQTSPSFQQCASRVVREYAAILEECLKQRFGLPSDVNPRQTDALHFHDLAAGLPQVQGDDPFSSWAEAMLAAVKPSEAAGGGGDHEPVPALEADDSRAAGEDNLPANPTFEAADPEVQVSDPPEAGSPLPQGGKSAYPDIPVYPESSAKPLGSAPTPGVPALWKPGSGSASAARVKPTPPEEVQADQPEGSAGADPAPEAVQEERVAAPLGTWSYLPIPDGLDNHPETHAESAPVPGGLRLLGGRVRGRSHKHLGTNCDDWFEFNVVDPWTIIAVSDGMGSRKLSRIGSKASCQAAVAYLSETLKEHRLKDRETWTVETFDRDHDDGTFKNEDLEVVQEALHRAMLVAYDAVAREAAARANSLAHYRLLNEQEVTIDDLSATLLLAVHTLVNYKGMDYSFVLTCQVGDGMMAAVDWQGRLQLLAIPDTGEYAGQTEPLTNRNKLDRLNLKGRTFPFFRPMHAFMAMTDGLADPQAEHIPYYPNNPGMLYLYADLLLNGIIAGESASEETIAAALKPFGLGSLAELASLGITYQGNMVGPEESRAIPIRSAALLARKLGFIITELMSSPAVFQAGAALGPLWEGNTQESRLVEWLDSYYAKGENDDRTLVVLYKEDMT